MSKKQAPQNNWDWVSSLAPEVQLILWICRMANGVEHSHKLVQLVSLSIDWKTVLAYTKEHRLLPLLYWNVVRHSMEGTPQAARLNIIENFSTSALRSEQLLQQLCQITENGRKAGIPIIHVKGPCLAITAYGDGGLRYSGDLDILVKEEQLLDLLHLLRDDGYKPIKVESRDDATWEILERPEVRKLGYELTLSHESKTLVDVHWHLMNPGTFDIPDSEVWNSSTSFEYRGCRLQILKNEINFLYLARHAAKHGWSRFRWLADLIVLIETPGFDFDELLQVAEKFKYRRFVLFALELVSRIPGTRIPDEVSAKIGCDPVISRQVEKFLHSRFPSTGHVISKSNTRETFSHIFALEDSGVTGVVRTARSLVQPTLRDWERFPVPQPLLPVLFLLRPLRLLSDYRR